MNRRRPTGFTLLEAMMAIVVLSSASLALYGWFSSSLNALAKTRQVAEHHLLMGDIQAYLSTLNITKEINQQFELNGYDIQLEANLLEPSQEARSTSGALGLYQLGLYRVVINIDRDGRFIGEFETRLVGYKQVRQGKASL